MAFPDKLILKVVGEPDIVVAGTSLTTRQTVANQFPNAPIGSMAVSTAGKIYIKVASNGASVNTDWERITTSAAD